MSVEEQSEAQALISRYARALDASDIPVLLECFTDDVSLSYESGRLTAQGRAHAETFFRKALGIASTHLLSNFVFQHNDSGVIVNCSGIACVCRKEGLVTMRGLSYAFTCISSSSTMRIRTLQHSLHWECDAPGGPR